MNVVCRASCLKIVIMKYNLKKLGVRNKVAKSAAVLAALGVGWSTPAVVGVAHAQSSDADVDHLPPAPGSVEAPAGGIRTGGSQTGGTRVGGASTPAANTVTSAVSIPSPVPYYIDRGVTMAPMKPLCDFLGIEVRMLDGVLSLTQTRGNDASKARLMTLRIGGHSAQITENGATRTVALSLPAETRLGNTFLPVRFIKDAFSVMIGFRARDNALVIRDSRRTGVLSSPVFTEYRGSNASIITITNRVGRALSLRLSGPQTIVLELGKNQSLTRRVRPGVYYYKGGSAGMKPRAGGRRLYGGRRATWSWGRR